MTMNFDIHNSHLENIERFKKHDPQLQALRQQKYVHEPKLLEDLPIDIPGIYTIGGGRQIGKSTLLKQWMLKLLKMGKNPECIRFITGEIIYNEQALLSILKDLLEEMPVDQMSYVIVDEVTYIPNWDRIVKYIADAGLLVKTELILTGSEIAVIKEARMRFPGRRGKADKVNFHLYPLSFYDYVKLTGAVNTLDEIITEPKLLNNSDFTAIQECFEDYLIHGGFLSAINEVAMAQTISTSTLNIYSDWVRGDIIKHNKQEHYLREIIAGIIKRYNSQITWGSLTKDLSIEHPKTVIDYVALLDSMDVTFVQLALLEDKLLGAPKKARKVIFKDPFIYHAMQAWLDPKFANYNAIKETIVNPIQSSALVEACVCSHYQRYFPTYYIKAEGEVDVAYVKDEKFWPVEVKWTNQLRPKDLKQISKYKNSLILTKHNMQQNILGIPTKSIALALLELSRLPELPI